MPAMLIVVVGDGIIVVVAAADAQGEELDTVVIVKKCGYKMLLTFIADVEAAAS